MTRTMPLSLRSRRRLAGLALTVAAMLTASACGTVQAGAAAVVGNRRISVDQVQQATTDLTAYSQAQGSGAVDQRKVLWSMVLSPFLVRAAAKAGAAVSVDEVRQAFASNKVEHPSQGAIDTLLAAAALSHLQQSGNQQVVTDLTNEIKSASIEINPRYGRYDPANLQIVDETPDWLVSTTPPAAGADGGPAAGSGQSSNP